MALWSSHLWNVQNSPDQRLRSKGKQKCEGLVNENFGIKYTEFLKKWTKEERKNS